MFMPSVTSPLKETAGIACPTALLLRAHHRACALLGTISDFVSWKHCHTFSSRSRTAMTVVRVSLTVSK